MADLDAAVAELEERGIDYQRAVQGESTVQIWISDPAGNTIELQQDTVLEISTASADRGLVGPEPRRRGCGDRTHR